MTKQTSADLEAIKKYLAENYPDDYEVTKMVKVKVDLDDETKKILDKLLVVASKELELSKQDANDWIFQTILRNYLLDEIVKKANLKDIKAIKYVEVGEDLDE